MNTINSFNMNWINNLIAESTRDIVFVWHIKSGRFSDNSSPGVPSMGEVEGAIAALLAAGAHVGFGDPDSSDFIIPEELLVNGIPSASKITALVQNSPKKYDFLVFSIRDSDAQPCSSADRLRRPLS